MFRNERRDENSYSDRIEVLQMLVNSIDYFDKDLKAHYLQSLTELRKQSDNAYLIDYPRDKEMRHKLIEKGDPKELAAIEKLKIFQRNLADLQFDILEHIKTMTNPEFRKHCGYEISYQNTTQKKHNFVQMVLDKIQETHDLRDSPRGVNEL